MPQAEGPCSAAKYAAWLLGSLLMMKLMSPWRYSSTCLERCLATSVKPSFSNSGSSRWGVGEANSTNSKPINPIGLSNRSAMGVLLGVVAVIDERGVIDGPGRWSTGYAAHAAGEVVADDELIDRRGHEVALGRPALRDRQCTFAFPACQASSDRSRVFPCSATGVRRRLLRHAQQAQAEE